MSQNDNADMVKVRENIGLAAAPALVRRRADREGPIMRIRAASIAVILIALASAAQAGPVRRAGEWRTVIDGGQPLLACFSKDETLDQGYVTRMMGKMPGAKCQVTNLTTFGPVTNFAMQCTFNGSVLASSGTITQTGLDAFSSKSHMRGTVIRMGDGRQFTIPDTDMTSVSQRLGPCRPGDRMIN
jgi:hypothetical protein